MTIPTDFSYLDAPEHVGSEYENVRKALSLYVKVLEAVEAHGDSKGFNSLANERFMRLLRHINNNLQDGRNFWESFSGSYRKVDKAVLTEVQKAFNGVTGAGLPAMHENRQHPEDYAQTAGEFRQQLWNLPPTLHEATIAASIAADFMQTRKQKIDTKTVIEVNGRKIQPWHEFASYFNLFLVM